MPFLLALVQFCGCASSPQSDAILARVDPKRVKQIELQETPFFPQERYQCGPAALATVLVNSGVAVTPEELVSMVYVPQRKGSFQVEMLAAARRQGRIPYVIEPQLENLLEEIQAGRPVLVLQNLGISWLPQWHFAVVVGFDLQEAALYLRSGKNKRRKTALKVFENTWRRSNYWGFVALKPGELPAHPEERKYFLAVSDYFSQNKSPGFLTAVQAGIEHWPKSQNFNMVLADYYHNQGNIVDALRVYTQLLDWYPDYAPAHNNLALVFADQGDLDTALEHAKTAVKIGGRFAAEYENTLQKIENLLDKSNKGGLIQ